MRARAALDEDTNERRTHAVLLICIWGARCRLCSGRVVTLVRVAGDAAAMRDGPLQAEAQRSAGASEVRLATGTVKTTYIAAALFDPCELTRERDERCRKALM